MFKVDDIIVAKLGSVADIFAEGRVGVLPNFAIKNRIRATAQII